MAPRLKSLVVGLLSDTHGLLRPEALHALRGADLIVHAGDVGSAHVLDVLRALAPLHVVRGNNDDGAWARELPETLTLEAGGARLHVLHDVAALALPAAVDVVVSGHSHRPRIEPRGGVLYVNPGSCGPRRFQLPVTVGRLRITAGQVAAEIIPLLP